MIQKLKLIALASGLLVAATLVASAQSSGVTYFYSREMVATNFSWSATVASGATTTTPAAAGATNLVTANYAQSGPWISTKGVTSADLNANSITVQVQATVPSAAACLLTMTFALALDDPSITKGAGLLSTNATALTTLLGVVGSTVTLQVPLTATANPQAFIYTIPAATFGGAHWFKLVSIANSVISTPVTINSARAGFWY
jgi:hypothetical protein